MKFFLFLIFTIFFSIKSFGHGTILIQEVILLNDNIEVKINKDITNIRIVKKYLFISLVSKFILEKTNLFMKTFFGLLNERIWLMEYFVKEYIFRNLKPELVEKKEPPIITRIK